MGAGRHDLRSGCLWYADTKGRGWRNASTRGNRGGRRPCSSRATPTLDVFDRRARHPHPCPRCRSGPGNADADGPGRRAHRPPPSGMPLAATGDAAPAAVRRRPCRRRWLPALRLARPAGHGRRPSSATPPPDSRPARRDADTPGSLRRPSSSCSRRPRSTRRSPPGSTLTTSGRPAPGRGRRRASWRAATPCSQPGAGDPRPSPAGPALPTSPRRPPPRSRPQGATTVTVSVDTSYASGPTAAPDVARRLRARASPRPVATIGLSTQRAAPGQPGPADPAAEAGAGLRGAAARAAGHRRPSTRRTGAGA